jgi:hypothetical protein
MRCSDPNAAAGGKRLRRIDPDLGIPGTTLYHPQDAWAPTARDPPQLIEGTERDMTDEKIRIRVTSSGQTLDVVVLNKRLDVIQIVLGEGVHSVRCDLVPTRNGSAYVGNAMGREIVYERSREDVKADLARAAGFGDYRR